jgi:hypothetical protein
MLCRCILDYARKDSVGDNDCGDRIGDNFGDQLNLRLRLKPSSRKSIMTSSNSIMTATVDSLPWSSNFRIKVRRIVLSLPRKLAGRINM